MLNIVCQLLLYVLHGSYMMWLYVFFVFHVYCVSNVFFVLCMSLCFMFPISNLLVVFTNVSQKFDKKWNKGKITLNFERLNMT
jgi:hypothetical protein